MKKGYTLIELIIVIVIIGVLMLAFRNVFQIKNRDSLYGEACINNLYGDVSNYLYSAITSKALISGTNKIYPEKYIIDFSIDTNTINFRYVTGNIIPLQPPLRKSLNLTGNVPNNYNCKTQSYDMILSGPNLFVTINKGLSEDSQLRSFIISGSTNPFTGEIKFLLKDIGGGTGYKELGKFIIDSRTQSIKNNICLTINNTGNCTQRNQ